MSAAGCDRSVLGAEDGLFVAHGLRRNAGRNARRRDGHLRRDAVEDGGDCGNLDGVGGTDSDGVQIAERHRGGDGSEPREEFGRDRWWSPGTSGA